MTTLWTVLPVLAQNAPKPEDVKAGWLGFAVFLALGAAVVLLALSLRKHLKRVDFEEPTDGRGQAPEVGTSGASAGDQAGQGTPDRSGPGNA